MMLPKIIEGKSHTDQRGTLRFNNDFIADQTKRIYLIQNSTTNFVRGWQGHKIEQRWFSVIQGSFKIQLIAIDNWETPSLNLEKFNFLIDAEKLDVLHVPAGYVSSIQAVEENSRLLVMTDYLLGEIQDEYRYDINYFDL